jgi:hypothetical protein
LDETKIRFFGADVALMYGAEPKTVAVPDSKHERRCLVWTDTWMKRNGKWQVIAVQDDRVDCPAKRHGLAAIIAHRVSSPGGSRKHRGER